MVCGDTGSGNTSQECHIAAVFVWWDRANGEALQVLVALPMRAPTLAAFHRFCYEADGVPGKWVRCRTRTTKLGNRTANVLFVLQGYLAQVMSDGTLRGAAVLVLDEMPR